MNLRSGSSSSCLNELQLVGPVKKALFNEFLKCRKCSDICIPPVFVCSTGHHFCEKCVQGMTKCICTSNFIGGRNFFYENCFENSIFKCKYLNEGCEEQFLGKEIKDHLEHCDYRPIACFRCKREDIQYTKFLKHYADSHKQDILSPENGEFRCRYIQDFTKSGTWRIRRVVAFDGHTFFPVARQTSVRNPRVGLFVWIFGNEDDAQKYNVRISLESDAGNTAAKKPKFWSGWEGPVVSIRMEPKEILDAGKCFITTLTAIQTAFGEESDWTPSFQITRVPVSTDDEDQEPVNPDVKTEPE